MPTTRLKSRRLADRRMNNWTLQEQTISCPYCGEGISVLLNPEDVGVDYIEDCQVCCRPIEFLVTENEQGALDARVQSELDC
ncbi:CPXCG motif-containing cysteine-rich protein [Luminiphilus sp. nBUS_07]|uniref:CPXCG motif-containing cysteine-rich protein n=1 Tax=Luminiphilus sp. nBUS_07 TaxID=3395314 RepID=UPI003EBBEB6B